MPPGKSCIGPLKKGGEAQVTPKGMKIVKRAENVHPLIKLRDVAPPLQRGKKQDRHELGKENGNQPSVNFIGPGFQFHDPEKEQPLEKDEGSGKGKKRIRQGKPRFKENPVQDIGSFRFQERGNERNENKGRQEINNPPGSRGG